MIDSEGELRFARRNFVPEKGGAAGWGGEGEGGREGGEPRVRLSLRERRKAFRSSLVESLIAPGSRPAPTEARDQC